MKYVVIVNGKPESGKDTFINKCCKYIDDNEIAHCKSVSSIDPVKKVLKDLGWDGIKTNSARAMLSMLKEFWASNNNGPTGYLINNVLTDKTSSNEDVVIFTHIREPKEIEKFRNAMKALEPLGIKVCTILVTRYEADKEYGNAADDNVLEYKYDYCIKNDGSLDDLKNHAVWFIDAIMEVKRDGNE
jgi:hypothetical protein